MSNPPTFNFHSEELGKIAESFARNRAKEKPEALQSRVAEEMASYTQTRNAVVNSMCAADKMCGPVQIEIIGGLSQSFAAKVTEQNKGLLKELLGFDLTPAKQQDPMVARKKSGPAIG